MNKLHNAIDEILSARLPKIEPTKKCWYVTVMYPGYIESELLDKDKKELIKYLQFDISNIKCGGVIGYRISCYPPGQLNVSGIIQVCYVLDRQ